jgi:hypothetical protein
MIHTKPDFFNSIAADIRAKYFATEIHGRTENQNYYKATYAIECFNNGALTYKVFIGRLAKACNTNNATIHNMVEKYIISFGQYQYKPRKLYSEAKAQPIN